MTQHYKVTSKELKEKLDDWSDRRMKAEAEVLKLSRKYGGSRTKFAESQGFGGRSFAFHFTKEPDKKHWKAKGSFWLPKVSTKQGTEIDEKLREIKKTDGDTCEIGDMIGMNFLQTPGIQKLGDDYYISTGTGWKINTKGLRRVSDVTIEKLIAEEDGK